MADTITFSERNKGWTSFHGWKPELMCSLNNKFFTIKDGHLYVHHDNEQTEAVGYNVFYDVPYDTKLKTVFNENPSDDKIFKTLVLEGNAPWEIAVETNYTQSTIKASEFNRKESRFFAYMRKNMLQDFTGQSVQGIGNIQSVEGNNISFNNIPNIVSVGDVLMQFDGLNHVEIGTITNIAGGVVTVDVLQSVPVVGQYSYSSKNNRIEGGEVRGYFMEVDMNNNNQNQAELFAVATNAVKSHI